MRWTAHTGFVVLCALLPAAVWALPWDRDMQNQPSIKAQESTVEQPESSVAVGADEAYPAPRDNAEMVRARLVAGEKLKNPNTPDEDSIQRGQDIYTIHCAVCHGDSGKGNGAVGEKFVPMPMNLTLPYVQMQADGQLYYTISHGSIAMPNYRDAMPSRARWDLVNYIKKALAKE